MEKVESAIGSTEQNVEEVTSDYMYVGGSFLSALGSRMARQEQMIRVWTMERLFCESLADVKTAQLLLNKTVRINWSRWPGSVDVQGDIGEEGWTALASGLQRHPGVKEVFVHRASMLQAPRAALKIIWDAMGALGTTSFWSVLLNDPFKRIEVVKDGVTEEGDELKWAEILEILGPQ